MQSEIIRAKNAKCVCWLLVSVLFAIMVDSAAADIIPTARRVAWQGNVGVPGGITNRTTICNLTPLSPLGGGADDQPRIQNAINNCPNNTVVSLSAGTFILNSSLSVRRSNITIRGAGPQQTIMDYRGEGGYAVFYILGPGAAYDPPSSRYKTWIAGLSKGSSVVTLSDVGDLAAGDLLILDQKDDNSYLVFGAGADGTTYTPDNNTRHMMQVTRVQSVSGTNVSVDPPVYMDYNISLIPKAYWWKGSAEYVGLENLKIDNTNGSAIYNIALEYTHACWIKNIESAVSRTAHAFIFRTKSCEIRDSYFHETKNYASSSYGVDIQISSACLIENNIFRTITTPMLMAQGASGNVFGYNYAFDLRYDVSPAWLIPGMSAHSAHTSMNLWEGNIAPSCYQDFIFGSSSHNTIFRNKYAGWESGKTLNTYPIVLEAKVRYTNIVGNVLGTSGYHDRYQAVNESYSGSTAIYVLGYFRTNHTDLTNYDAGVIGTTIRHGNWDSVNNAVIWDAGNVDHAIPNSLYLSSKPAFFGRCTWPPIGPDLNPMVNTIPAKARYEGSSICDILQPPSNLRTVQQ